MKRWIFLTIAILALVVSILPAYLTIGVKRADYASITTILWILLGVALVVIPLLSIIFSKKILKIKWLRWSLLVLNLVVLVISAMFNWIIFTRSFGG
ncbi:MAG: hypothetical protein KKD18_05895 [Nanoarchaeota archaeon]|nr:hypothetical protein [Nanoarchaeota archaeon]MBU0977923.1 hypothetical protein [Nanoarchaeota archaeon]